MNIDLVFTNEEQLGRFLFTHLITKLMLSLKEFKDDHKCAALWYVGPNYADCASSENFEILDTAYISTYIRKHPGTYEETKHERIMSVYLAKNLEKGDGTCNMSFEISILNLIVKIRIDRVYAEKIDTMTPHIEIEFCSIDKNIKCDPDAVEYYKNIFTEASREVMADAAFFEYDDDQNITGYSN